MNPFKRRFTRSLYQIHYLFEKTPISIAITPKKNPNLFRARYSNNTQGILINPPSGNPPPVSALYFRCKRHYYQRFLKIPNIQIYFRIYFKPPLFYLIPAHNGPELLPINITSSHQDQKLTNQESREFHHSPPPPQR